MCEFSPPLPTNYGPAQGRLHSLLKQLQSQPTLLQTYHKQIMKNLEFGIIERILERQLHNPSVHYIPHHCVICHT